MIPQNFLETLQSKIDIVQLISEYLPLKRAGRNFKALCPFHQEKTPSFLVSPQKQIFHCFGCGKGGGIFQFVMFYEKMTFPEAVELLSHKAGLKVPFTRGERGNLKNTLYEIVSEAASFFHQDLLKPEHQYLRDYLKKRGINHEGIKKFYLGSSFSDSLISYLRGKGFNLEIMEKASLIAPSSGGWREIFKKRIIFPIFDLRGRIIAFGGRLWQERENSPKYINSPESPIYTKRNNLFGIHLTRDYISKKNNVLVVEGYLDMIVPFLAGVENIVASLGTSFSEEQIKLLKRFTSNITLVYDADKAGEKATLRAIELLLEQGLEVGIVILPKGEDPASFVLKQGKDNFLKAISLKYDFFDYKLKILNSLYDAQTIAGKSKIVHEMLSLISKLKSVVSRFEYIKKLSFSLDIKEEILIAEYRKISQDTRSSANYSKKPQSIYSNNHISLTEKAVIKFMITNPGAASFVKKYINDVDFSSLLAKKAAEYFLNSNLKQNYNSLVANITDNEISSFISSLMMDETIPLDKEFFRSSIIKLRQAKIKDTKRKLKEEIKEAEKRGDIKKAYALIAKYNKIKVN